MSDERFLDLRYWKTLLSQRRWMILSCFVGLGLVTLTYSYMQEPIYRSSCKLYLAPQRVQTLSFVDIYAGQRRRASEFLQTQIEIIRSTRVLEQAVMELENEGVLRFGYEPDGPSATFYNQIRNRLLGRQTVKDVEVQSPEAKRSRYISRLKRALEIEPIGGNAFVTISIDAKSPVLAARLVNSIASAYLRSDREIRRRGGDEAVAWLSRNVRDQREKVLQYEKRMQGLKQSSPGVVEEGPGFVIQEVTTLQDALLDVRLKLVQAEAGERFFTESLVFGEGVQDGREIEGEIARALRLRAQQDLVDTVVRLKQLRERYDERHPDVQREAEKGERLRKELKDMPRLSIVDPITEDHSGSGVGVLSPDISILRAQEKMLSDHLEEAVRTSSREGAASIEYTVFQRELEINRSLYNEMLGRLNEIIISTGLDTPVGELFEEGTVVKKAVSPNHHRNLLLGLLGGLLLGVASAAVRDHFDHSVQDPLQANSLLKVPVLGLIPDFSRTVGSAAYEESKLTVARGYYGGCGEAYRIFRSHIEGALASDDARTLLISSVVPGEGKTTVSANLAAAFAESGQKVLLVDADFWRPSLNRYFGAGGERCVSRVIRGEIEVEDAIRDTDTERLDLLGCDSSSNCLDGLQMTKVFMKIFTWARDRYDRIVVDTSIVMATPGVTEISRAGAPVLLVHRPGSGPAQMLEQVREHFLLSNTSLVGVVLNGIRPPWVTSQYPFVTDYRAVQKAISQDSSTENRT